MTKSRFKPNSAEARDIAYHVHGQTDLSVHGEVGPLIITRGEGVHVWDSEGNKYIEGMAGLWSVSLGFSESRLIDAARQQLETLPFYHTFGHKAQNPVIDLAEALVTRAPGVPDRPLTRALFQNSGSEAVDTAIKLVWYYHNAIGKPDKKKIIARHNAYHGVTVAAASATGLARMHADFDLPIDRILHADCPHYFKQAQAGEDEDTFADRMARDLESLIVREGPDTIGAFLAEPVQGAGGVIVPPEGYFPRIQKVLEKYDILLIADEVITGFCRTGNYWGSETFGLRPHMLTCAKALSGSYLPISAVLINDAIHDTLVDGSARHGVFGHGYTYSGHPVPAAVALETLKIYDERDILGHVRSVMPGFASALHAFADNPLVGEVRLCGLVGGIELMASRESRRAFDPAHKMAPRVAKLAEDEGLIIRAMGDTLAICPPLVITAGELEDLMARLGRALDAGARWAQAEGIV
ncbi:MAG: aminotransferase [Sphingomonadales bacterium]